MVLLLKMIPLKFARLKDRISQERKMREIIKRVNENTANVQSMHYVEANSPRHKDSNGDLKLKTSSGEKQSVNDNLHRECLSKTEDTNINTLMLQHLKARKIIAEAFEKSFKEEVKYRKIMNELRETGL